MAKFHKLKVVNIIKETADCISIAFEVPQKLKDDYKFIQGQYITLKLHVNGEELRRCYSICTSPVADDELRVAAKKVEKGRGSTWLNESLKVGDVIDVLTPMGNFYTELKPSNKKNYVLLAGGSGITPMMSILKTILHVEPESNIIMFYGNKDKASIIFKEQLDQIAEKNSDRFKIYHILDHQNDAENELLTGIMSPDKTKTLLEKFVDLDQINEYFICGPPGMKDSVLTTLQGLNIDKSNINIELFTVDTVEDTEALDKKEKTKKVEFKGKCEATIIIDGDETVVEVKAGDVILQAALDADLDAPFSCRGGMCCTCRAKLIEGEVKMDVNYALTDAEVESGYILTCQSHPTTSTVVVNYDEAR